MKQFFFLALKYTATFFEACSPFFVSIKLRQKIIKSGSIDVFYQHTDVAIIVQGPIVSDNSFTYETLKLYRVKYPKIKIIFSTWVGQNREAIELIKKLNINVIESEIPAVKGNLNINLQLVSTISGLYEANGDKKIKYILKTRSDQRIYYRCDFLNFFKEKILHSLSDVEGLKAKLLICNLNTYRDRLYGVSDMFMFGFKEDMNLYWNIPLEEKNVSNSSATLSFDKFICASVGEGYLVNNFFRSVNFIPEWTIRDSDFFFEKYFVIVSKEQIDIFWNKYQKHLEDKHLSAVLDSDKYLLRCSY